MITRNKNKSIFPYIGGKSYVVAWLDSFIDYNKKTYVELFAGGANLLWYKKPHRIEIINDVYDNIVNFYIQLKTNYKALQNILTDIPYSRTLRNNIRQQGYSKDALTRAAEWYYLQQSSFGGQESGGFAISYIKSKTETIQNRLKDFKWYSDRLRYVHIENKSYSDILESIKNNSDIFIYADPPYIVRNDRSTYVHDFKIEDHINLAKQLNQMKCKVMLSYYLTPELKKFYSNWNIVIKEVYLSSKKQQKREIRQECLLFNF